MKYRVFLDNGETVDFDDDYKFQIDDNNCLLVTENYRHVENSIIARFSPFVWRYHRLIDEDEPESPKIHLFYFESDDSVTAKKIGDVNITTKTITYTSEYGNKCDIGNWAVVFTFDEHGFQVVDINEGVSPETITKACEQAAYYVASEIKEVRELQ